MSAALKIKVEPTKDEISMVQMMANDMSPKEIAQAKNISTKDVYYKILALKKECQCKTNQGLVILFLKNNLIK